MRFAAAVLCTAVTSFVSTCPFSADLVYSQDFTESDPTTGLPPAWTLGPRAHVPFFSTARDDQAFGAAPPSIRVDLPMLTLNYRLATPYIRLPRMDQDYTLEFALQVDQPDSPFRVEIVYMDLETNWIRSEFLLSLVGEQMDSLRVFRIPFNPKVGPQAGGCWITFGLSYSKVLREGSFRLDDFRIREGQDTGRLTFYLSPESVGAGEPVDLHISAASGSASIEVWQEGERSTLVYGPTPVSGLREEPIPSEAWWVGCGWPTSTSIPTGADWPSAVYTVKIDDGDQRVWDTFVIRGKGTEGKLLLVLPTFTDQAYNGWGGGSFYSDPQCPAISFDRPDNHEYWGVFHNPIHFIRWLHRSEIDYAVADDTDLHFRPELISSYPAVALTWHSEYWTREMRRNVERYIASGGSLLNLSGNTCWWQARLVEADDPVEPRPGRRLICYKYTAADDPYQHIDSSRVTTHWDEPPLNDPPTRFLGTSWRAGGAVNASSSSTCPCEYDWLDGYGGYEAFRTEHWVFEGTGLRDGDTFGQQYAILGHEVDGAAIEWVDGQPVPLPGGGVPGDLRILGYSPCLNYYRESLEGEALMTILDRGSSFVFSGGTTGWCWGLADDPVVQRITRNLIDRVQDRFTDIERLTIEAFPNPAGEHVVLRLLGPDVPETIRLYGVDGRLLGSSDVARSTTYEGLAIGFASWSFRDAAGRELPSGVYLARAPDGATARIVKVR